MFLFLFLFLIYLNFHCRLRTFSPEGGKGICRHFCITAIVVEKFFPRPRRNFILACSRSCVAEFLLILPSHFRFTWEQTLSSRRVRSHSSQGGFKFEKGSSILLYGVGENHGDPSRTFIRQIWRQFSAARRTKCEEVNKQAWWIIGARREEGGEENTRRWVKRGRWKPRRKLAGNLSGQTEGKYDGKVSRTKWYDTA